jgi:hypothetical protein
VIRWKGFCEKNCSPEMIFSWVWEWEAWSMKIDPYNIIEG